jgi:phospholipid/cholesterol/gamma-HCH transport system substrate-binding protein
MQTRAPRITQVMIAIGFALSCFGLMLFLWISFGGPLPLKPMGYRFEVPFDEATQLAQQSDVRISGVSVGKVVGIKLGSDGLAHATVQMDSRYAPIPDDTRATLRQKTLLGETYVELSPGSDQAPSLPEDGSLPRAQVAGSVQLDEIFRSFNEPTRVAFQQWMQNVAIALKGRGADLSAALGELDPFAESADRVLRILDTQRLAVRQLVRGGGDVFNALSERDHQLRGLIQNTQAVFSTTARRNQDLQQAFIAFPTFEDESRKTLIRLDQFAQNTDPLIQQLRPAARQLSPTLQATGRLAPDLQNLFVGLRQAIDLADTGFPALRKLLDNDLSPLLARYDGFGQQLNPIIETLKRYRHEITALLGNLASATNATTSLAQTNFSQVHYLRTESPLSPEALAAYPNRLKWQRSNAYVKPQGYNNLSPSKLGYLQSFETRQCSTGPNAHLDASSAAQLGVDRPAVSNPTQTFNRVKHYAYNDEVDSNALPAVPCDQQPPVKSIGMFPEFSRYLHVRQEP